MLETFLVRCHAPPTSHTFSLKPSFCRLLMLKPWVGMMLWRGTCAAAGVHRGKRLRRSGSWCTHCVMSSSDRAFRMVVLPALSRPSTRTRASFSVFFNLRKRSSSPIADAVGVGLWRGEACAGEAGEFAQRSAAAVTESRVRQSLGQFDWVELCRVSLNSRISKGGGVPCPQRCWLQAPRCESYKHGPQRLGV